MPKKQCILVNESALPSHQHNNSCCIPGLANRLVPQGQALNEAKKLAQQLLSFPQLCMRQDLRSTRRAAFAGLSLQERLKEEFEGGKEVLEGESVQGAQRFAGGEGRGGAFDFNH